MKLSNNCLLQLNILMEIVHFSFLGLGLFGDPDLFIKHSDLFIFLIQEILRNLDLGRQTINSGLHLPDLLLLVLNLVVLQRYLLDVLL